MILGGEDCGGAVKAAAPAHPARGIRASLHSIVSIEDPAVIKIILDISRQEMVSMARPRPGAVKFWGSMAPYGAFTPLDGARTHPWQPSRTRYPSNRAVVVPSLNPR